MSEKVCNTCAQTLPFSAFNKHKGRADGHLEICRTCRSEARKAHYASSAEERAKVAETGRAYYAANKDIIAPKKAAYVQRTKEAHNERGRNWYHANLEKARALGRAQVARYRQTARAKETIARYHQANLERFKAYRAENSERIKAAKKVRYELNKPAILAAMKDYYRDNAPYILLRNKAYAQRKPEIIRRAWQAWQARNPEKVKENGRKWRLKNPLASRVKEMRRRVRLRAGGNHLVTQEAISQLWHKQTGRCVYCRAKLGDSPKSKQAYHVDHIHPVSKGGTNEPHNLQCLCPPCNLSKGAKLPHVFAQERGRLFF